MVIDNTLFGNKRDFYGILKMDKNFTLNELKEKHERKEIFKIPSKGTIEIKARENKLWLQGLKEQSWNEVQDDWNKFSAFTPSQAMRRFKGNFLHLYVAFKFMGEKNILKLINSSVISKQTIKRTIVKNISRNTSLLDLRKFDAVFYESPVDYTDNYVLHKIAEEDFLDKGIENGFEIYILEIKRESSGNQQYIFVDNLDDRCQTAIGAAAWSMIKENGERMTQQEFIKMNSNEISLEEDEDKLFYTIVTENSLDGFQTKNKIKIKGETKSDCIDVILNNRNLVKEVLNKMKKLNPDEIVFEFVDIHSYEVVYTKDFYEPLIKEWVNLSVEREDYELAQEITNEVNDGLLQMTT